MERNLQILVASDKNFDEAKHQLRYYFTILNAESSWRAASEYCSEPLPPHRYGDVYRERSLDLISRAKALEIYNAKETIDWMDSYHFEGLLDLLKLERDCIDGLVGTREKYAALQCSDLLEWDAEDASSNCFSRDFDTAEIMECI